MLPLTDSMTHLPFNRTTCQILPDVEPPPTLYSEIKSLDLKSSEKNLNKLGLRYRSIYEYYDSPIRSNFVICPLNSNYFPKNYYDVQM